MLPTEKKNTTPDPHADTPWTLVAMQPDTPVDHLWAAQAGLWALSLATDPAARLGPDDQFRINCLVRALYEHLCAFETGVAAAMRDIPMAPEA
jgi:hypothetical protein